MRQPDGSIKSANNPTWDRRAQTFDTGLYYGIVTDRESPVLNPFNPSQTEMYYAVRIIGGHRDGTIYNHCRVMQNISGRQNFEDFTLKNSVNPIGLDFASEFNFLEIPGQESGDYVFIQFLNGDTSQPIIVGFAKSPLSPDTQTPELPYVFGQQKIQQFNGVRTKIDPMGDYTMTKATGAYLPFSPTDIGNPTIPYINEFVPLPGFEEAFKMSIDTTLNVNFGVSAAIPSTEPATGTSLEVPRLGFELSPITDTFAINSVIGTGLSVAGATDSVDLSTLAGANLSISGIQDSVSMSTLVGSGISVSGLTDSIDIASAGGASVSVAGLQDSVTLSTTSGATVAISPIDATVEIPTGAKMNLGATGVSLVDATGAGFETSTGFIKIKSASGEELVDLIDQLITSLSTATYAGFGAPGSNVADLIQLAAKIKLIKGG